MHMMKIITLMGMVMVMVMVVSSTSDNMNMSEKCMNAFEKLESCLVYASGKADAPGKECCGAVAGIKESDPACLCFIIQQAHNGSSAGIKSAGIQETRLLLLPSSCHLINATISNCPKLLNLAPNSTDAKIFTDPSFLTNATTTPVINGSTVSNAGSSSSGWRIMNDFPQLMLVLSFTTQLFSF